MVVLFAVYSILSFISRGSGAICLNYGYSTLWLLTCFIWGATLRRYIHIINKMVYLNIILFYGLIFSICIPYSFCLLMRILNLSGGTAFLYYTSPLCIIEAMLLLVVFSKIKNNNKYLQSTLKILSNNSLGTYLLQCHPAVYNNIIMKKDVECTLSDALWKVPVSILIVCLVGTLLNIIIDKIMYIIKIDKYIDYAIKNIFYNISKICLKRNYK